MTVPRPPERLTWDEKNVFRQIIRRNEADPTQADKVALLNKTLAFIDWAERYALAEIQRLEKSIASLQVTPVCAKCGVSLDHQMYVRFCYGCARAVKDGAASR